MVTNDGREISPERAGLARSIYIVTMPGGNVASANKRMACVTNDAHGVTHAECIIRHAALSMGIWGRKFGYGDITFELRKPHADNIKAAVRGTLHVCSHTANKGSKQACIGRHNERNETCDYMFVSVGDSVKRYKATGYDMPAIFANANATVKAARDNIARDIATLAARFTLADVLASPFVQQVIADDIGLIDADAIAAMYVKATPKATRKPARKPANKPANK